MAILSTKSKYLLILIIVKISQWIIQVLRDIRYAKYISLMLMQVNIQGGEIVIINIRGDN